MSKGICLMPNASPILKIHKSRPLPSGSPSLGHGRWVACDTRRWTFRTRNNDKVTCQACLNAIKRSR